MRDFWSVFPPILYGEKIIGYIVIGQIRSNHAAHVETDGRLADLFDALPVLPMDKINSAIRIPPTPVRDTST